MLPTPQNMCHSRRLQRSVMNDGLSHTRLFGLAQNRSIIVLNVEIDSFLLLQVPQRGGATAMRPMKPAFEIHEDHESHRRSVLTLRRNFAIEVRLPRCSLTILIQDSTQAVPMTLFQNFCHRCKICLLYDFCHHLLYGQAFVEQFISVKSALIFASQQYVL